MGNSSRACQAAGGWQFLKPPGTPMVSCAGKPFIYVLYGRLASAQGRPSATIRPAMCD